ncbi:MAG: T9SS type A sorting domain-containing protein [Bacteroidetes bacterium]|nr:T9SS type A sorting domain-containing protein [Bacteroidota bacterium]
MKEMRSKTSLFYRILLFVLLFSQSINAQWTSRKSGTDKNLHAVNFTSAEVGYTVGDAGTILKTTNAGVCWSSQTSGVSNNLQSVIFTATTTGYAVGSNGLILKTNNGGKNWDIKYSGTGNFLSDVFFTDTLTGYSVGGNGTIIKTIDGGEHWISQAIDSENFYNSVYFSNANIGYIVGYEIILKTTNGGSNWSVLKSWHSWMPIFHGLFMNLTSVCFTDSIHGYITGYGYAYSINAQTILTDSFLLKTIDGGLNWTEQVSNGILYDMHFKDAESGYAAGTRGSIVKTMDSGSFWQSEPNGMANDLFSICYMDSNMACAVGKKGVILTSNAAGIPCMDESEVIFDWQIYPSPTNTSISFEVSALDENSSFVIYDMLGKELKRQTIDSKITRIDVSLWNTGIYFIKLVTTQLTDVRKFIKE